MPQEEDRPFRPVHFGTERARSDSIETIRPAEVLIRLLLTMVYNCTYD
jgi:hypothetical protein